MRCRSVDGTLLAADVDVVKGLSLLTSRGRANCCVVTLVLQVHFGVSILRYLSLAVSLAACIHAQAVKL